MEKLQEILAKLQILEDAAAIQADSLAKIQGLLAGLSHDVLLLMVHSGLDAEAVHQESKAIRDELYSRELKAFGERLEDLERLRKATAARPSETPHD